MAALRVARNEARQALVLSNAIRRQIWGDVENVKALEEELKDRAGLNKPVAPAVKRRKGRKQVENLIAMRGGKVSHG